MGCLRVRCVGDREVLDREARRVEERYVVRATAAFCLTGKHGAEFRHVRLCHESGLDRRRELAAVARLL